MRSGATWVGTDWWPSGSSAYAYSGQSQTFYYTAERVSGTRKIKVSWWMTTECNDNHASPTYYLCWKNQKLTVNGAVKINWSSNGNPYYTSGGNTVYYGFTDTGSWLDNKYRNGVYYDTNGDYTGIRRYLKVLGTKWTSGSFELTANDAGNASFTVEGNFGWYGKTGLNFYKSFDINGLVPTATYSIQFNENKRSFVGTNTISGLPSTITKTYNKSITLPSLPVAKDRNGNITYKAVAWATSATDSFTAKDTTYKPGATISTNSDLTFYAIWEKEKKTVTYDVGDGRFLGNTTGVALKITNPVITYYSANIILPSKDMVSRYGSTLSGWRDSNGNFFAQGSTYTVYGDVTLSAVYAGNTYNITLCDINGNTLRTLQNQYRAALYGNFTYSPPGYTCAGWTTNANSKRYDIGEELPPIVDNLPIISSINVLDDYMYVGCGNYTSTNPFILPDVGVDRKNVRAHIIGQDIKLYPILIYDTSFYIYHNNTWKLAMPYIYSNNMWRQSTGYIYLNNNWKR
jgi:hypothetical protein